MYEDILEMEFNLAWYLNGYHVSNDMDFRELHWMYERLKTQLEKEKHNNSDMEQILQNMAR